MTASLANVKSRFSDFVRCAQTMEPVFVTKHGKRAAVLISVEDYEAKFEEKPSVAWLSYESWREKNAENLEDEDPFADTRDKWTPPLYAPNDFDEV